MMSTESANSFTLIGEASDGGTMENLSRRLKVNVNSVMSGYSDHIFLLEQQTNRLSLILSHPGDQ